MPTYKIIIPVLTKVIETHVVQANSAEEALITAETRIGGHFPVATVEDEYFHEPQFDQAKVTLVNSDHPACCT